MKAIRLVAAALLLALPAGAYAQQAGGDEIVSFEESDPEMNAAIAEARRTLPGWFAVLADPPAGASGIAFKYPLEGWEHIWVDNVVRDGEFLEGTLSNNPHAEGYAIGDPVSVPIAEVSDWAWWDGDGVAHGYHTVRVMLGRMPPEQAAATRRSLGWD